MSKPDTSRWSDAERAEFDLWWDRPSRHEFPSPVLRALLRGEPHTGIDEHERAFPSDMGIKPEGEG